MKIELIILLIFLLIFMINYKNNFTKENFEPLNYNLPIYYRIPYNKRFNYLDTIWKNPLKWTIYNRKCNCFKY